MASELPDSELLNVPTDNLRPGELVRAFQVKAVETAKKLAAAQPDEVTLMLLAERREEAKEAEHEELHRREERLLAELDKREQELFERAEGLDTRAIKLDDGRRAYVDGDKYRDAEGRELKDADRAQAEIHHLDHPNAATWQEKHDLDEQFFAATRMRHQIEELQEGKAGANEATVLSRYEKQLQTQSSGALSRAPVAADYADVDYMGALLGPTAKANPKPGGPAF
jgi:hypothetical protein